MTYCLGWPEGPESLVRFAEKLGEEFVFEVLFGLNFPIRLPHGWELQNKDTQRRLAP